MGELKNNDLISSLQLQIPKLDIDSSTLAEKLENARERANSLKTELEQAKLSPNNSTTVQELKQQLNNLTNKLSETKKEATQTGEELIEIFNKRKEMFNFNGALGGVKDGFDSIGKKIDSFKKRVTSLILSVAIFNVISNGLTKLRNNLVTLLKTNSTFNNNLNQIRANLMTAFAPIYNAILPAINTLMNALAKVTGTFAVFVSNLFGMSTSKATKEAKKLSSALDDASKSGSNANDTVASFDKLDVLQEDKGSGGGNSNSIDYSGEIQYSQKLLDFLNKVKDVCIDVWNWMTKNKELVIALGIAIAAAFVVSKIIAFISSFSPLVKLLSTIGKLFITVGENGTKSLNKTRTGTALAIAGFVILISSIWDLIKNWENLNTKQKLVRVGFALLGAAAITLGIAIAKGISIATLGIGAIVAVITTAVVTIGSLIIKLVKQKDAILSVEDAQKKLIEAQQKYIDAQNNYVDAVDKAEEAFKNLEDAEKRTGISGEELYKSVENGSLKYEDMTKQQREVYKAYLANDKAQKDLKNSSEELTAAKKEETLASFANQLAIAAETGNYDEYKNSVVTAYNEGKISAEEARDLIEQSMSRMSDASQKTFMEDLPEDIKEGMDPDKYQTAGQKLKNWFQTTCIKIGKFFTELFFKTIPEALAKLVEALKHFFWITLPNLAITGIEMLINKIIEGFEGLINMPINAINSFIDKANEIPTVNIKKFSNISLGRIKIPRLAKGTVIPPRHEFMAILGDQKRGTNIEAPLETIKQANREENRQLITELMSILKNSDSDNREITLKFTGNLAQLARILVPEIEKETNRKGIRMIKKVT